MMTIDIEVNNGKDFVAVVRDEGPLFRIGVEQMSLITGRCHLWVEVLGTIRLHHLRSLRRTANVLMPAFDLFCNVEAQRQENIRFARFFDFVPKERVGDILVMERG